MHTHTHTEGDRDQLRSLAFPYVPEAEPSCTVFHYISIRLHFGLM